MTRKDLDDLVLFAEHTPDMDESLTAIEKCLEGQPLQRTWNHFTSPDQRFFTGVWEAEPGRWRVDYTEHEYCRILSGRSRLYDESGRVRTLQAGDDLVIPAGFRGQWEVLETTRKIYVIYQP